MQELTRKWCEKEEHKDKKEGLPGWKSGQRLS
jgi:hypothetical protein